MDGHHTTFYFLGFKSTQLVHRSTDNAGNLFFIMRFAVTIQLSWWWAFLLSLLIVEFLFKTDSGYPKAKDTGVTVFTLATPGNPFRYNTHRSVPPVSALAHSRGPRKTRVPVTSLSCSNIETCMDRPKSVVRVIRGVA